MVCKAVFAIRKHTNRVAFRDLERRTGKRTSISHELEPQPRQTAETSKGNLHKLGYVQLKSAITGSHRARRDRARCAHLREGNDDG